MGYNSGMGVLFVSLFFCSLVKAMFGICCAPTSITEDSSVLLEPFVQVESYISAEDAIVLAQASTSLRLRFRPFVTGKDWLRHNLRRLICIETQTLQPGSVGLSKFPPFRLVLTPSQKSCAVSFRGTIQYLFQGWVRFQWYRHRVWCNKGIWTFQDSWSLQEGSIYDCRSLH